MKFLFKGDEIMMIFKKYMNEIYSIEIHIWKWYHNDSLEIGDFKLLKWNSHSTVITSWWVFRNIWMKFIELKFIFESNIMIL